MFANYVYHNVIRGNHQWNQVLACTLCRQTGDFPFSSLFPPDLADSNSDRQGSMRKYIKVSIDKAVFVTKASFAMLPLKDMGHVVLV